MGIKYDYGNARGSSHGTMRCTVCGKQITEGRYRYRQKSKGGDWGYVAQHEACTQDDASWAQFDAHAIEAHRKALELSDACAEFKAKWSLGDELDDYIISTDG